MNANDAVAILRKHNEWRRADPPEGPDDMPDMPSACSAREIGVAIDVLCDEVERLRSAQALQYDARLAALERAAVFESRLHEIGDLAASCRTGPALLEVMAQIEKMTDMRPNNDPAQGRPRPEKNCNE